jgi:spore maturation protein CgeB
MAGLPATLWEFDPAIVIFVSGFFTTKAMLEAIRWHRHKIVLLATESPYQDDEQLMRAAECDLAVLNDPCNLGKFQELCPTYYQPHSYRPAVHYPRTGPRDPGLASDFVFIGTAFKSRIKLFEALNLDGIDFLLAGNEWGKLDPESPIAKHIATGVGEAADCIENERVADLYRHSRIGLNYYRREGEEAHANDAAIALGPREVEQAACGLFYLRDPRPEGDEVFKGILPTFDGPEDASEKLRWWLAHDGLREKRATQAREAIVGRTFVNAARRLLQRIEDL